MRDQAPGRLVAGPLLPALLAALLVAGCGSTPAVDTGPAVTVDTTDTGLVESQRLPPSAFSEQFAAAEQALLQFDWMSADHTLSTLVPEEMSPDDLVYRSYLQARIYYLRGHSKSVDTTLAAALAGATHPALRSKLLNFKRYRDELSGNYLESARLSDNFLQSARTPEVIAALKRSTWLNLQRLSDAELEAAAARSSDPRMQAWLQLALLSHEVSHSGLTGGLAQWLAAHPDHPAAGPLPGGLGHLLEPKTGPYKVALILPLSGRLAPAGEAVRDGYLASYYAGIGAGNPAPELLVLDRLRFESAAAAYQSAVNSGADLVVGPLTKEAVVELAGLMTRPVPILALNRADQALPQGGSALVQFSLAAEDEAEQLATLAFGQGARRAFLLRPEGAWGNKMERQLTARWQSLGGSIATTAAYGAADDYAASMTAALGLSDSEQRSRQLHSRLALPEPLEFTPRRRQDLDVVFLLSRSPAEAQALNPLLSYYYAGDLPVYATSGIHRGTADPRNKDLNGIHLVDLPWLLGSNPGLRLAIAAGDTGSDIYTRLNALGADAHRLQTSFRQLQAGPDALVRGDTGLLTLDPQLRILRETRLATFDGGVLKPE